MDRDACVRWLVLAAEMIHGQREALTELDKRIGDGDHGINMDRGFQKLAAQLDGATDIASALKTAATVLISTVGGAAGPLYGTFFLRASAAASGMQEAAAAELAALWEAGLEGVRQRGKAQPGDKTMVDALAPAVEALKAAAGRGAALADAVAEAAVAAERGVEATIPMVARKGRASYLGERSAGTQDPGATSSLLLLRALQRALA